MAELYRWLYKLTNVEIPDISERFALVERCFLLGFIIVFTLAFIRTYPTIFLGFGLGDEFQWSLIYNAFATLEADTPVLFYVGVIMLVANILFRLQLFLRGQFAYRSNDPELPMKTIVLFMAANSLNIVFVLMAGVLLGGLSFATGFEFDLGFNAVDNLFSLALSYAERIPTLVALPLPIAFLLTYIVQGFFHYWIHRLCHLNRFLWLVLHRFHHMPPILTPATTNVVIVSIPFHLGIVFVKTAIFSAISALFYPEPLFVEMFFFHLIITFADPYGHQTALFKEGISSRWISALCFFSGNGVYHYLHHSRDEDIVTSNKTNQVNIGGGIGYCWDLVFGTFKGLPAPSDNQPNVGLWGNPRLHHNPIRIVLSGLLQVLFELRFNKGFMTKCRCVFGSVHYTPPITRHYHIQQ